jgi:hypothetical protein
VTFTAGFGLFPSLFGLQVSQCGCVGGLRRRDNLHAYRRLSVRVMRPNSALVDPTALAAATTTFSVYRLQFQTHGINTPRRAGPLTPEEEQQQLVSRTLLTLGIMVICALLLL